MMRRLACTANLAFAAATTTPATATATATATAAPHQQQKRSLGYINAFIRTPTKGLMPRRDLNGNKVDLDAALYEWEQFVLSIKQTVLFDDIHLMSPWGSEDSMKVADSITHFHSCILPMPRHGQEHRMEELNDTIRFVRAHGFAGSVVPLLQENEGSRAHGGDFVSLPMGLMVAETERTNLTAIESLKNNEIGEGEDKYTPFPVYHLEYPDRSPPRPLADYFAFGGVQTLIAWDTWYGNHALKYCVERIKSRPWEIIKIEEGCEFLSFYGGLAKYDVIIDEDYTASIDALGNAGFNPVPVKWEILKNLGWSMRSIVLVMRFSRGGFSAGGFGSHDQRKMSESRVITSMDPKKRVVGGERTSGLHAQVHNGELGEIVEQPTPRYKPPMHVRGGIVPREGEQYETAPVSMDSRRPGQRRGPGPWPDQDGPKAF